MTEYDYSEEGRRRYMATQNRIAKWVHNTESAPQLKSPFTPRSNTGSGATVRAHPHGPSHAGSRRPPMMQFSRGPMAQQTYRQSHAPSRPPPSALRSQIYPTPSQGGSRAAASTVHPSQSISQAGTQRTSENSPSTHAPTHQLHPSYRSSAASHHTHHTHHHHRSPTYIISPPPSPAQAPRSQGVIIVPRRGKAPRVVYY